MYLFAEYRDSYWKKPFYIIHRIQSITDLKFILDRLRSLKYPSAPYVAVDVSNSSKCVKIFIKQSNFIVKLAILLSFLVQLSTSLSCCLVITNSSSTFSREWRMFWLDCNNFLIVSTSLMTYLKRYINWCFFFDFLKFLSMTCSFSCV